MSKHGRRDAKAMTQLRALTTRRSAARSVPQCRKGDAQGEEGMTCGTCPLVPRAQGHEAEGCSKVGGGLFEIARRMRARAFVPPARRRPSSLPPRCAVENCSLRYYLTAMVV